jgi:hypothetical protein
MAGNPFEALKVSNAMVSSLIIQPRLRIHVWFIRHTYAPFNLTHSACKAIKKQGKRESDGLTLFIIFKSWKRRNSECGSHHPDMIRPK